MGEDMINFDNQLLKLTEKFYRDYSKREFPEILHSKEYQRRYSYSTLKYFHKELGIE